MQISKRFTPTIFYYLVYNSQELFIEVCHYFRDFLLPTLYNFTYSGFRLLQICITCIDFLHCITSHSLPPSSPQFIGSIPLFHQRRFQCVSLSDFIVIIIHRYFFYRCRIRKRSLFILACKYYRSRLREPLCCMSMSAEASRRLTSVSLPMVTCSGCGRNGETEKKLIVEFSWW